MKLYAFLSELLDHIEDLQTSINSVREIVKRKIQEAQQNEQH